ncbi:hypothetical protein DNHGIG_03290 [Collibacillus ludicampi]|jgi:hypothetical protein|uniref:Uncharacterized protein n=1 Tax=Collibacillus ludicampi TaxID=2771369 RepID=A0AAV4LAF9_9BACL|nr:hypothetical protein DNHGIG_03290 [Collibacillus ludicampi]
MIETYGDLDESLEAIGTSRIEPQIFPMFMTFKKISLYVEVKKKIEPVRRILTIHDFIIPYNPSSVE